VYNHVVKSMNN